MYYWESLRIEPIWKQYLVKQLPNFFYCKLLKRKSESALGVPGLVLFWHFIVPCFQQMFAVRNSSSDLLLLSCGLQSVWSNRKAPDTSPSLQSYLLFLSLNVSVFVEWQDRDCVEEKSGGESLIRILQEGQHPRLQVLVSLSELPRLPHTLAWIAHPGKVPVWNVWRSDETHSETRGEKPQSTGRCHQTHRETSPLSSVALFHGLWSRQRSLG